MVSAQSIERVERREVVSIETDSHTFFAEGIVSHNCCDSDSIVQCVREDDMAWGAPGANRQSVHVELAGRASQGASDWQDAYSQKMLANAAKLVADICKRHVIAPIAVDVSGLLQRGRGITTHDAVSKAFKQSTHWDPGPGFPIAMFINAVRAL
jgi:N-acetyl-anhydromuramyl-L-alanine amidase AmpD